MRMNCKTCSYTCNTLNSEAILCTVYDKTINRFHKLGQKSLFQITLMISNNSFVVELSRLL